MTDAPGCERFADAILADASPRPEGLDAHLEGCSACRELAAAHRAASALPSPEVVSPAAVAVAEVVARVRRRRAARFAGAGVAAAALVAVVLTHAPSRAPDADGTRTDLFALADGVAALTSRDPMSDDPALRRLGAVSDWLAPPRARSFGLDSIVSPSAAGAAGGAVP
jgi:hypothetical protein